ncbi:hypothetical protein [Burkholderia vietnamiensis]|uniref:hypothetical protein n=1 Tax=Burkholderia vietnamiensis TaxID=60552 RepID=UPI0026570600|nr:hypothetical protein [Burkholderia vietnamiensis]MDN8037444.1 hypothetical protein [Burkholderia vietnamiensis]
MAKVKHTRNGNVKLVLDADEAEALRTLTRYGPGLLERNEGVRSRVLDVLDCIDFAMCEAGITAAR